MENIKPFWGEWGRWRNDRTLKPSGVCTLAHIHKYNPLNNTRGIEGIVISD